MTGSKFQSRYIDAPMLRGPINHSTCETTRLPIQRIQSLALYVSVCREEGMERGMRTTRRLYKLYRFDVSRSMLPSTRGCQLAFAVRAWMQSVRSISWPSSSSSLFPSPSLSLCIPTTCARETPRELNHQAQRAFDDR